MDGCGGPTDILVLRADGVIEGVSWLTTAPLERLLRTYDANFGDLLMRFLTQPAVHFSDNLEYFGQTMIELRNKTGWVNENDVFSYRPEPLAAILSDWGLRE